MSALALCGWMAAALAVAAWWRSRLVARSLVAAACHEVRGPLTAAMLALDFMRRRSEAPDERLAGLDEQLRRARRALEDLHSAPDGLVAPDRLESVCVAELLTAIEVAWAPTAAARGRVLRMGAAPRDAWLLVDPIRFSQAVGNLVANALEHGAGAIDVRARAARGRVRVEVRDEGCGLPAPVGEIVARGRSGTAARGHGLAIAASIATRSGGRLTAAPSPSGASLAIELPLRDPGTPS